MFVGIMKTAYATRRIYVRARDVELEGQFDNFQTIKKFMDMACCWGGIDKSDRDLDDQGGFVSWEMRDEDGQAIYDALLVLLTRCHLSFEQDLMKATDTRGAYA